MFASTHCRGIFWRIKCRCKATLLLNQLLATLGSVISNVARGTATFDPDTNGNQAALMYGESLTP
jgi:hypothetical protein